MPTIILQATPEAPVIEQGGVRGVFRVAGVLQPERVIPQSDTPVSRFDADLLMRRLALTVQDHQLTPLTVGDGVELDWESSDPGIATVSADGFVTRLVGNEGGSTLIRATHAETGTSALFSVSYPPVSGKQFYWQAWKTGTLAAWADAQIRPKLTGSAASRLPLYSARDRTNHTYTRNPECWANAFPGITAVGNLFGSSLALVTPDVGVQATHNASSIGTVVDFVTMGNAVFTRTIADRRDVGTDLTVCRLDEPLPASIIPADILPASAPDKLPTLFRGIEDVESVAAVRDCELTQFYTDQFGNAPVGFWPAVAGLPSAGTPYGANLAFPEGHPLADWFSGGVQGGDSGHASFGVYGTSGRLTVLSVFTSGGPTGVGGPSISSMLTQVETARQQMGSSFALTVADLSAWTSW